MSLSPRTVVKETKCGVGGAPVVGYMNGSGGAIPPCRAGLFLRASSEYRLSLLTSLRIRRRMPLTDRSTGTAWGPLRYSKVAGGQAGESC